MKRHFLRLALLLFYEVQDIFKSKEVFPEMLSFEGIQATKISRSLFTVYFLMCRTWKNIPSVSVPTKTENSNFLPFLAEIILFWPPDGLLGLIRKSPSRAQRPISAVKIPHSPLSPLSSAKQPVSEDVPENKRAHHNHCGLWLRPIHGLTTMNTAKSQMKVLISPLHSSQREKGFPFNNFPP